MTDLEVRNARPRQEKYALSAGHGLTLIVMPDGSKYWRLGYRFGGKPKMIVVGKPYPETTLKGGSRRSRGAR
ncbi:Arm DNA-binding domain-containing protein [Hydrocarboniphaga sp.]|uniref:Arm DNA-binding domain-containing protein n=1 Tax=Hydrocarboniphaga sp. TaxID=2033016 RepID=UPI0026239D2D|nr:Arm DNA-binding domain-containing protein [Hydrocarboniphaga sp.]